MAYQSPQDEQTFTQILARDPDSRTCFECGYDNAPWCIATHGIFVCLDCSGRFRGLGVHLCFVRSSTMDAWHGWNEVKTKQMVIGGNARCRKFFETHGLGRAQTNGMSLNQRFSSRAALMYRDLLEAEAKGEPFSEARWQPPEWWTAQQQNNASAAANLRNASAAGGAPARQLPPGLGRTQYGSAGSNGGSSGGGGNGNASGGGGVDDFLSYLGSAASTAASTAAAISSQAATSVALKSRALAETVEKTAKDVDLGKSLDTVGEAASSAWGWASSWTSAGVSALTSITKTAVEQVARTIDGDDGSKQRGGGGGGDDALSALTRNVRPSDKDYGHTEHRAPARPQAQSGDIGALAATNLAPSNKYEGIGSSPVSTVPRQQQQQPSPVQPAVAPANVVRSPIAPSNVGNTSAMDDIFGAQPAKPASPAVAAAGPKAVVAAPVKKGFGVGAAKPQMSSPTGSTSAAPAGGESTKKSAGGWDDDWE